jgi:hypothetical protein
LNVRKRDADGCGSKQAYFHEASDVSLESEASQSAQSDDCYTNLLLIKARIAKCAKAGRALSLDLCLALPSGANWMGQREEAGIKAY